MCAPFICLKIFVTYGEDSQQLLIIMGNQQSSGANKYVTSNEVQSIINVDKTWERLQKQLNKSASVKAKKGCVDFYLFVKIIQNQYEYIVSLYINE